MANISNIRVAAFDLDGTLTQHKTPLDKSHRDTLDRLGERYHLIMVGAGMCRRIYNQMEAYPIDIIGNYGMQFAKSVDGELVEVFTEVRPVDKELVEKRVTELREQFGFTQFAGENVEYHDSGCITFPVLGTKAKQEDKLAFDPDRSRRRPIYPTVKAAFPEYTVFVGGSSSFDLAPKPFDKSYALKRWCDENGYTPEQLVYFGDDYGPGGNDESVYKSDFGFVCVDDYRDFPKLAQPYLL